MKCEQKTADCGDLIIELSGEFDALGCSEVRPVFQDVATRLSPMVVFLDLSAVSFLDSSGIGSMVFLFKRLSQTGRSLIISGVHGQPRELLELLRIHKAIPTKLIRQ
ncbi:MAG: STAS domain-containing protein [Gammaproteobacteria bacterium]|nr:STAS domain-containing protein [Gammaproteobacteria bacterium]